MNPSLSAISLKGENTISFKPSHEAAEQDLKLGSASYTQVEKAKTAFGNQGRFVTLAQKNAQGNVLVRVTK